MKICEKSKEIIHIKLDLIDYLIFTQEYLFVKRFKFLYFQNFCLNFLE